MWAVTYYRPHFTRFIRLCSKPWLENNNRTLSTKSRGSDALRWQKAQQSVFLQYTGSPVDCLDFCEMYGGKIQAAYHHRYPEDKNHILVEFSSQSSVERLMHTAQHFDNDMKIPVETRYLFFRSHKSIHGNKDSKKWRKPIDCDPRLCEKPPEGVSESDLLAAGKIDQQMAALQKKLELSEYGYKMRYFIASTTEELLQKVLPLSTVQLFGSAVSGLGRYDCDLDMVMDVDCESLPQPSKSRRSRLPEGRLLYLTRTKREEGRQHAQSVLDLAAAMIQTAMPQSVKVHKVLQARVPIVQFVHNYSGIECDLCVSNRSGVHMSQLLLHLSQVCPPLRPLVFTVRTWARSNEVTYSNPGPWLSNFMLTLLVIFFLQQRTPSLLPPIGDLVNVANVPLLLSKQKPVKVRESSGDLLKEFLQFYGAFDFGSRGISTRGGCIINKPDELPLYLENPLETDLNCSKNVMITHLAKFQEQCQNSLHDLEAEGEGHRGLVAILRVDRVDTVNIRMEDMFGDEKREER